MHSTNLRVPEVISLTSIMPHCGFFSFATATNNTEYETFLQAECEKWDCWGKLYMKTLLFRRVFLSCPGYSQILRLQVSFCLSLLRAGNTGTGQCTWVPLVDTALLCLTHWTDYALQCDSLSFSLEDRVGIYWSPCCWPTIGFVGACCLHLWPTKPCPPPFF